MSQVERDFLDEFRDDETPAADEEVAADESDSTATAETPEADTPTEPEAPAAPDPQTETHVPYAAMKAEREKRQARERELQERDRKIAEYERQLQELRNGAQPQQPVQAEQKVEIWEDPDAFVSQRLKAVEQTATQRLYAALEEQAREAHPDYDEVFAVVQEHAKTNPAIAQRVLSAPNPALAAYRLGKQLSELKQMEDPEAYRAKVEAEVRAKIEAELQAKADAKRQAAQAIPPDLSSSRSVAGTPSAASEDVFETLFPRN
ncbi:hypothetical protein ACO2Q2_16600 [Dyella sp. KRB-257]|uniref:hypothetical protein n=1 Tax=Dyella sp. KRB-257 TaxID=3400915 RepID=UPI003C0EBD6D